MPKNLKTEFEAPARLSSIKLIDRDGIVGGQLLRWQPRSCFGNFRGVCNLAAPVLLVSLASCLHDRLIACIFSAFRSMPPVSAARWFCGAALRRSRSGTLRSEDGVTSPMAVHPATPFRNPSTRRFGSGRESLRLHSDLPRSRRRAMSAFLQYESPHDKLKAEAWNAS